MLGNGRFAAPQRPVEIHVQEVAEPGVPARAARMGPRPEPLEARAGRRTRLPHQVGLCRDRLSRRVHGDRRLAGRRVAVRGLLQRRRQPRLLLHAAGAAGLRGGGAVPRAARHPGPHPALLVREGARDHRHRLRRGRDDEVGVAARRDDVPSPPDGRGQGQDRSRTPRPTATASTPGSVPPMPASSNTRASWSRSRSARPRTPRSSQGFRPSAASASTAPTAGACATPTSNASPTRAPRR